MDIAVDELEVQQNETLDRFEIHYEGHLALLTYELDGSVISYLHTEVPAALGGHGIAGVLAKHALDYARSNGLGVRPLCPFVRAYVEKHPVYEDLVVE